MKIYIPILLGLLVFCSCRPKGELTGWDYNNPRNGGFQKVPYCEQETAVGMILIEGREMILPRIPADTANTIIKSFYISKYQETNGQYLVYLDYLKQYYSEATYSQALPDTTFWFNELLDYPEQLYLTNNYLRDPLRRDSPVLGLNPEQIARYAEWKTDRMNEIILIREEVIEFDATVADSSQLFSTADYLYSQYTPPRKVINIQDLNPNRAVNGERGVRMEDGILIPKYRLPTPEEWQLAALAIGDNDYKYIRTPKEAKIKLDLPYFSSLAIKPVKSKSKVAYIPVVRLVYDLNPNNYGVYGLHSGFAEMVQDSLDVYTLGSRGIYYPAKYCDTISDSIKYLFPHSFNPPMRYVRTPSTAIGFRLAMPHVGSMDPDKRRRKGKR